MYYNLKIKSKDSEFILESKDKDVIKREMDLYFASLLDVSKEFLDGIKHVEIKSKDVKSIDFLENYNEPSDKNIPQAPIINQQNEIIEEPIIEIETEEIKQNEIQTFVNEVSEDNIVENEISEPLVFKNDKVEEVVVDIDSTPNIKPVKDIRFSNVPNKPNIKRDDFKLNSTIKAPRAIGLKDDYPLKINKNELSFHVEKNLIERKNNIERLVSLAQSKVDDVSFDSDSDIVSFDKFAKSIDNTPSIIEDIDNSISNYEPDFKEFLSKYKAKNVAEEFLICAYYIKNILRLENFTMKFINSRLFQATGAIADMTTVQQLISRNYIRFHSMDDAKTYSITKDGEKYFATQFKI